MGAFPRSDPAEAAGRHLAAGRVAEARAIYQQVLQEQPRHVRALCGLGAIALRGGEVANAFELIGHAVAAAPDDAMALGNLGVVYLARKELDEAEACFRRALDLDPGQAELHANFASLRMARGDAEGAIEAQSHAVELAPQAATQHYNLGNLLLAAGRRTAAEAAYRRCLDLEAGHVAALNNLAMLVKRDGRLDEAAALLDEALLHDPLHPELTANRADLLLQAGEGEPALAALRRAIGLAPMNGELRASLGAALLELGRLPEAGKELAAAVRAAPRSGRATLLLARLLRRQGQFEGALAAAERAAAMDGVAAPAAEMAGELLLMLGRPAEGWARLDAAAPPPPFPVPDLGLEADLAGRAIRLVSLDSAAGLFAARFIPVLAARGAVVTVVCPPVLAGLLATVPGVAEMTAAGTVDLAALAADGTPTLPLDMLPRRLGAVPDLPGADLPTFRVPATERPPAPRIGLWWEGPGPGRALIEAAGCGVVSLQTGAERTACAARLAARGIADGGGEIGDFLTLARAIRGCDAVIAPDGPVAHLAAGLGVATWVLVGRDGSWCWPHGDAPSPWYPASRAFRQAADGSWTAALAAVRTAAATLRNGGPP